MNRRTQPRFQISAVGWLALLNNLEHPDECRILDISSDGIRMLADEDLPVDEAICLGFHEHILVVRVRNVYPRGSQFAIGAERIFSFPKEDFGAGPPTFEKLQALLAEKGWAIEVNSEFEDAEPEPMAREKAPAFQNGAERHAPERLASEQVAARRVPLVSPAVAAPERMAASPVAEAREPESSVMVQEPPERFADPRALLREPPMQEVLMQEPLMQEPAMPEPPMQEPAMPEPPPMRFPEPVDRRSGPVDWGPLPTMPEPVAPRKSMAAPVALAATIVLLLGGGALYVNYLRTHRPASKTIAAVTTKPAPVNGKTEPGSVAVTTETHPETPAVSHPETPAAAVVSTAAPTASAPAKANPTVVTPAAVVPPSVTQTKTPPVPAKTATPVVTPAPVAAPPPTAVKPTPAPATKPVEPAVKTIPPAVKPATAATTPAKPAGGLHHVKVSILEPAWLTASADGKPLLGLGKMYAKNETFEFDFSGISFVHLGNSRGVVVIVDGKQVTLPEPHAVVGVLQLTPSGSKLLPWTPKDPVAEPRA